MNLYVVSSGCVIPGVLVKVKGQGDAGQVAMALTCVRPGGVGPDVGGLVGVSLRVGPLPFLAPQH